MLSQQNGRVTLSFMVEDTGIDIGELHPEGTLIENQINGKILMVVQHELLRYSLHEILQGTGFETYTIFRNVWRLLKMDNGQYPTLSD